MTKQWVNESALMESLSGNLLDAMSMFPKRLVRIDEIIRQFHMPLSHIQVLSLIASEPLTISQISSRMGVAKPNVTPLVDKLDELGYVQRGRSDTDKRIVLVMMTDSGHDCLMQIRSAIAEQIRNWPVDFSMGEVRRLNNSLGTLNRAMNSMNDTQSR